MNRTRITLLGAIACCPLLIVAIGCSKSSTNASTGSSMTAMSGKTLVDQMGGMSAVNNVADSFASNLSANPVVTKYMNAESINSAKLGLVNEVAKASGMAPPNPGADLKTALSGKGMDAEAMKAVNGALSSAADAAKLGSTQKSALMGIVDPISKSVLGN